MKFYKSFLGYLKFLKIKDNSKKKLVIYSESKNYRNYLIDIIESLSENEKYLVIYLTSDLQDLVKINDKIEIVYIGDSFFRTILFAFLKCELLIMTLTDLNHHTIKKSINCKKYIYLFHSLISTHKGYTFNAFRDYDVILTNGDYQRKEILRAEEIYGFPSKKIINTGYPYLNFLKKNYIENNNENKQRKILFAPSWSKSKNNFFEEYIEKIIIELTNNENYVILRTHPEVLKRYKKKLNYLDKIFSKNKNFELNTDLQNLDPLNKSNILLTDNGGMGLEYSYIHKKPVIFLNHIDKINNEKFNEIKIEPIEDKFKKEFGNIIDVKSYKIINSEIKKIYSSFDKKKYSNKVDLFFEENGIITKNQAENIKKAIDELLLGTK